MLSQVKATKPQPQDEPGRHVQRPERYPCGAVDMKSRDAKQEIDRGGDGAEENCAADAGVIELHEAIHQPLTEGEPNTPAQLALEQDLPHAVGPSLLLVEV